MQYILDLSQLLKMKKPLVMDNSYINLISNLLWIHYKPITFHKKQQNLEKFC